MNDPFVKYGENNLLKNKPDPLFLHICEIMKFLFQLFLMTTRLAAFILRQNCQ